MKKIILTAFVLILVMAAIPLLMLNQLGTPKTLPGAASSKQASGVSDKISSTPTSAKPTETPTKKTVDETKPQPTQASSQTPAETKADKLTFKVLDSSTGKTTEVSDREFCVGALAAEMPPTFEKEALKAQTVALYTFFTKERTKQRENPSDDLKGADFKVDSGKKQGYIPKEKCRELWKDSFEQSYNKLEEAVNEVFAQIITYGGKPITAVYCAITSGVTENGKTALGLDEAYLKSVASPWDELSDGYLTTVSFTQKEVEKIMKDKWGDVSLPSSPQEWFSDIKTTDAGTVSSVTLGEKKVNGQDLREAFSLRSASFDVVYTLDAFVFTVRGYGHGAGLSQYGANEMAKQGADFSRILSWYYPGTEIESVS